MNDDESVHNGRLRRGLCVSASDACVVCDSDGVRMAVEPKARSLSCRSDLTAAGLMADARALSCRVRPELGLAVAAPFMGRGRPLVYRLPGGSDWQWFALALTAFHGGDVMDLTLLTHADSLLASRMAYRLRERPCMYLDGADHADWDAAMPRLRGLSAGLMPFASMDDGLSFGNDSSVPSECVAYMPCRRPPAALTEDMAHFTAVSGPVPTSPLPTLAVAGAMLWSER